MKFKNLAITCFAILIPLLQLYSQSTERTLKITGKVIDQSNQPVKGVQLVVDHKILKSFSGPEGQFHIKIPAASVNIGITLPQGRMIEEPINGRLDITIIIPDSIHGEILAQAEKLKGNRSSGNDYSMYTNIYDLIRAKLPAVQVSGTNMKVRGAGSFMADSQPLFVVNGTSVASISDISPLDVASIELLKGPDASIYGSRGANGVILIRLKKGRN